MQSFKANDFKPDNLIGQTILKACAQQPCAIHFCFNAQPLHYFNMHMWTIGQRQPALLLSFVKTSEKCQFCVLPLCVLSSMEYPCPCNVYVVHVKECHSGLIDTSMCTWRSTEGWMMGTKILRWPIWERKMSMRKMMVGLVSK